MTVVTYSPTGAEQTFTWPAGVLSCTVDVSGAAGQGGGTGYGGRAQGTITKSGESTLAIYVGTTSTGFNGGGTRSGVYAGGASDIRQGGTALANRIIIAGGGGSWSLFDEIGFYGGSGGGSDGLVGQDGGTSSPGGGASSSAGGAAGSNVSGLGTAPTAGSSGQGGNGGSGTMPGGSGGGGYYGGGGGGADGLGATQGSGGGGGSGYIGGVSSASMTTGYSAAYGIIYITYTVPSGAVGTRSMMLGVG